MARPRHVFRVLHYDNRGDPALSNRIDYAWLNRFDAVGARIELPANVTLIAQWMGGDTAVGPSADGRGMLIADFRSYFGSGQLLAPVGIAFTLRYDRMHLESTRGSQYFDSQQDAHAWTAAYLYDHDEHWLVGIEGITNRRLAAATRTDRAAPQQRSRNSCNSRCAIRSSELWRPLPARGSRAPRPLQQVRRASHTASASGCCGKYPMPTLSDYATFALLALGMALTPGPNMMYLVSRSISQGHAAGFIFLGGVALAFVLYLVCAALGITAILMAVPFAYEACGSPVRSTCCIWRGKH